MSLAAVLIGFAAFLYSMEMWSRKHPTASEFQPVRDTLLFTDRFMVGDTGASVPALSKYLDFIAESGANGGLIHNYINRGLRQLTLALQGVSDLNLRVRNVDQMQRALAEYGDSLQAHPRWALDPGRVRPAMLMTVEIMGSLNLPYDADARSRIKKVEEAALALEADRSTLWQRPKVQDFFIYAGQAMVYLKLRALSANGAKMSPPL